MRNSEVKVSMMAIAALATMVPCATAAELISAPFSIGYGWSPTDPMGNLDQRSWNTNETASTNTPNVQGDFMFTSMPEGGSFSASGVSFVDRVLTDRGGYAGRIEPAFVVPVTANFIGAAPANAASNPNYRLLLEISKISIWIGDHNSSTGDGMAAWSETTDGHTSSSSSVVVMKSNDFNEAQAYVQLSWDPDDYEVPLAALNDPFIRTFDILNENSLRYTDGLEVEGRVALIYNEVPEPATILLLSVVAGCAVCCTHWNKRK